MIGRQPIEADLIYDVGAHRGEDTAFYLAKGYRVVAIEADPDLYAALCERFADELAADRVTLLNVAVAFENGPLTFYKNCQFTEWGTIMPAWRDRNAALGTDSVAITVSGRRFASILAEHGVPYYLKVDIEGADTLCLSGLLEQPDRPRYISIESNKTSWTALERDFDLLSQLGFNRFKVVDQRRVHKQVCPFPAREGRYVAQEFLPGASGLFGAEAPGRWMSKAMALLVHRFIYPRYRLFGDAGLITRGRLGRRIARRLGLEAGWYDIHASLGPG
jgi:FkbM family methyltransferase